MGVRMAPVTGSGAVPACRARVAREGSVSRSNGLVIAFSKEKLLIKTKTPPRTRPGGGSYALEERLDAVSRSRRASCRRWGQRPAWACPWEYTFAGRA